ncbi:MAG TPA: hypothetical protein VFA40_12650 [Terriglobales bacterium]|jgi:hypothetical protein|nr:hypothetical protein [Terriglobales bacterium]
MKTRTVLMAVLAFLVCVTMSFAQSPQMGTWKLNEAKSKIPAGAPKNTTVVYEAAGDSVKVTVDGVDGQGKPAHNEWTGKFDGKDYPVTGDTASDVRSYKQIDDHTLELTAKKGGKVTIEGKVSVSADGKTRTVQASGTDPSGKKVKTEGVYDKQ